MHLIKEPGLTSLVRIIIVVAIQLITCSTFAQISNFNFEHLTTDDGLSSNKVEDILQDGEGFYWIATKNGLNRFDGTNFKIFLNDPDDSTSLTHNNCTYLLEDINGDIWVATYKGISKFVKKKGFFQPIYLHNPLKNFEVANRIFKMASDKEGNVWVAGNGLWKYDIRTAQVTLISNSQIDSSAISDQGVIFELWFDQTNNGLWLTTGTQLNFYSINKGVFYHAFNNPYRWNVFEVASPHEIALDYKDRLCFRNKDNMELCYFESSTNEIQLTGVKLSPGCRHMEPDKKNRLWLSYWGSLSEIFDPAIHLLDSSFFIFRHRHSLMNDKSRLMCVDQQNNYWIASDNGISIYNDANQYYKWHTLTNTQMANPNSLHIKAMVQGEGKKLWIATTTGLFEYDLQQNSYRQLNELKGIRSLALAHGYLWIAAKDHIMQMDVATGIIHKKIMLQNHIIFIQKGSYDELWAGIWTGGLYSINLSNYEIEHFSKEENT
ncbi:MAG: hypothetical protein M3R25_12870, partial [Bacteroidota bacterium]|nr:hypothetical protein [Bacteroidota bacterium]